MTGPFYSVGPIKNVLVPGHDVQFFLDSLRDRLLTVNWTLEETFAGSGGTTGYRMKTFVTPKGQKCNIKFYWAGAVAPITFYSIVVFYISDGNQNDERLFGSITISADRGNKVFRALLYPHQMFLFCEDPNYQRLVDVNDVMGGVPVTRGASQAFWGVGWGTDNLTFRTGLVNFRGSTTFAFKLGTVLPDGTVNEVPPQLISQRSSELVNPVPFNDGNWPVIEPFMIFGIKPDKLLVVTLWDAIVVCKPFATKITSSADLHLWESFTLGSEIGSLFLVTASLEGLAVGSYSY